MKESTFSRDREIDAALRVIHAVEPRAGFEQRLMARLSLPSAKSARSWGPASTLSALMPAQWRRGARLAFGAIAAATAGLAIFLGGSIHRGATTLPKAAAPTQLSAPQLTEPKTGFGAASGMRLPAGGMQQQGIQPEISSRGRATRHAHRGRAVLPSVPAHRATGAFEPSSPYGKDSFPSEQPPSSEAGPPTQ